MHTVTAPRQDKNTRPLAGTVPTVGTGHRPHRGGAGRHAHKGTARNRTRSDQNRNALRGW